MAQNTVSEQTVAASEERLKTVSDELKSRKTPPADNQEKHVGEPASVPKTTSTGKTGSISDINTCAASPKLDTSHFDDVYNVFSGYAQQFHETIEKYKLAVSEAKEYWVGKGKDAFKTTNDTIEFNLQDLFDLTCDLRDKLLESQVEYKTADEQTAKLMNTAK